MARSVSGRRVRSPNLGGASDVAVKIEIASLCSGQLTGCGYCRVSWCRHLRVSRRIQLATRRPATHNARDAAFGIPRRTHYDDIVRIPRLDRKVKLPHHRGPRSPRSRRPFRSPPPPPPPPGRPLRGSPLTPAPQPPP